VIRFVDMRPAEAVGSRFAFFDTVRDRFVSLAGDQSWDTWALFEEAHGLPHEHDEGRFDLERFRGLCPPWVFEPVPDDAGPKWHETFHVEHDGDESVVYFAHEAREVARWQRLADAAGLELGEWLTRLADRETRRAAETEMTDDELVARYHETGEPETAALAWDGYAERRFDLATTTWLDLSSEERQAWRFALASAAKGEEL
jgi:hypothetical protein